MSSHFMTQQNDLENPNLVIFVIPPFQKMSFKPDHSYAKTILILHTQYGYSTTKAMLILQAPYRKLLTYVIENENF